MFLSAGPSAADPEAHRGGSGRSGSEAQRQTGEHKLQFYGL